ncbi:hypothetical protein RB195_019696 [Necator americanus]|uniref:Protein Wnt n=1 Tax=Necator americanus TaxID=51031 RepID=A0ABR1CIY0_NECAM
MRFGRTLLLCIVLVRLCASVHWLALGLAGNRLDRSRIAYSCKNMKGLTKKQIRFCRKNPDMMDSVQYGAQNAYAECQYQFNKRRWNCTLIDPVTLELISDVIMREGTRESAFVHAVSAAGVAYRVTRDCARGLNERCGCDQSMLTLDPQMRSYDYQGCSDNVQYGIAISREFVDAAERGKNASSRAILNLHNNRAGRQVLEKSLRRECKCHGMSGSCEIKTCWDTLPSFREIGMIIKDKFDGASEVAIEEEDEQPRIVMKNSQFKRHTNADLIYMSPSPDFCDADPARGIFGTKGRECNVTSQGVDGCQLLCCNRGFERRVFFEADQCNCKFHYCCRVECEPCERRIEKNFCL